MKGWAFRVVAAVAKDLARFRRSRSAWAFWAGIPLVLGSIVVLATEAGATRGLVWVVVEGIDGDALLTPPAITELPVDFEPIESREEALGRLERGDGSAVLLLRRTDEGPGPITAELLLNPREQLIPEMVAEGLEAAFLQLDLQVELAVRRSDVPGDRPIETFAFLLTPGIILLAILFAAQGVAEDFWLERECGTLARAFSIPGGGWLAIAGKVGAGALSVGLIAATGFGAAFAYHGLPWSWLPFAVLWSAVFAVPCSLLLSWLVSFAGSRRAALALGQSVVLGLVLIGGSFFPLEIMPAWAAAIGKRTPNGWAVEFLLELCRSGPSPSAMLSSTAILIPITLGLAVALHRQLRRRIAGA